MSNVNGVPVSWNTPEQPSQWQKSYAELQKKYEAQELWALLGKVAAAILLFYGFCHFLDWFNAH